MFRALSLSLQQLGDPAIIWVFVKSFALTLIIFVGLGAGAVFGARALVEAWGWGAEGGFAAAATAALAAFVAAWLLFRAVAMPVMTLFADEIVAAIEAKHYPEAAKSARPVSVALGVWMALGSIARLTGANLIALPLYLLLIVTGIGPLILFVLINAWLLGRDLGEMVAARHLDGTARRDWLRVTRGERGLMGLIVTGLFVLPFVNFIAPIMGAAMATHLFHGKAA
jgi:CysZ protein